MKITIVHGTMRKGSTFHCLEGVIDNLSKHLPVEKTEFFLPKDMPHFCAGCYNCFLKGENACPHAEFVQPISDALKAADLVVLTSPVYGFDVSAQMKALIDHLCYMWMSHRPAPEMFGKIGLIVGTTAGMGLGHTSKTMKNSMLYWGVKRIFTFTNRVAALKWDDVASKTKEKIALRAAKLAKRIAKAYTSVGSSRQPLFRSFLFSIMSAMQKKNNWNPTDREHWQNNGWLNGKKPF